MMEVLIDERRQLIKFIKKYWYDVLEYIIWIVVYIITKTLVIMLTHNINTINVASILIFAELTMSWNYYYISISLLQYIKNQAGLPFERGNDHSGIIIMLTLFTLTFEFYGTKTDTLDAAITLFVLISIVYSMVSIYIIFKLMSSRYYRYKKSQDDTVSL